MDPETYESKSDCSWGLIHHQVMQHIDIAIASVLQNVDVNPKAQTIEALVDAIDADVEYQGIFYLNMPQIDYTVKSLEKIMMWLMMYDLG